MKGKLALVLVGSEDISVVKRVLQRFGWCEFRVDEFLKRYPEESLEEWISFKTKAKKIGTVRWKEEHQGKGLDISDKERLRIYSEIIRYVDYVDVEIKSSIAKQVVKEVKEKGKKTIVSYHNFLKTPKLHILEKIYLSGKDLKPDIIKIATSVNSTDELFTLIYFTKNYSKNFPLVVIPMKTSFIERLTPLLFGSLFTYISFSIPTAPGQISYRDIGIIEKLFKKT